MNTNCERRGRLIGPIESYGTKEINLKAFETFAFMWSAKGWLIESPHTNCAWWSRAEHQRVNFHQIVRPSGIVGMGLYLDAVIALPGWDKSYGAKIEALIAKEIGLPVLDAVTGDEIKFRGIPLCVALLASTGTESTAAAPQASTPAPAKTTPLGSRKPTLKKSAKSIKRQPSRSSK